ncbi:MAG TPA: DUF3302 domain-containing protein [Gammaproteobacteria bacterium]|nr:DUF3302 domain-containing protein [Gammaproteobacteria bacterium]
MRTLAKSAVSLWLLAIGLAAAGPCSAEGSEFVDSAANFLAVFIIILVPIGGIVLFWLVHILPEKFAEKRHHPQLAAIKVLCLLSLIFGGLLWPLAWLWAFTKPVMHQLAYGRDKHDDYYEKHGLPMPVGDETEALRAELGRVQQEIAELEKRGDLPTALQALRERLAELEAATAPEAATTAGVG